MATKSIRTNRAQTNKKPQVIPGAIKITAIVAFVLLLLFTMPYMGTILFSGLIVYTFNPVYKYFSRKTTSSGLAVTGTLLTASITVIIPLVFVLLVTIAQINTMVTNITNGELGNDTVEIDEVVDWSIDKINGFLASLPGSNDAQINEEAFLNTLKDISVGILNALTEAIAGVGSAVSRLISTSILGIFLMSAMLTYQKRIVDFIKKLSPFDDSINNVYLDRAGAMTIAMVKGQFIIAAIQGTLSALSLWVVGIDYFWFFMTILIFMSFIPLGAGIITIPIGVIMILTGNIPQGIFIIIFHIFVISNVDNLLRPRLVPKSARLNSAVLLLAVFSGIALFGAIGVVFGPVVMILLVSALEIYARYNVTGSTRPRLLKKSI